MAALRHAAQRLCGRALQGAPRIPPGRRPMSTTSNSNGKPDPTIETRDTIKLLEQMKQESENFLKSRPLHDATGARLYAASAIPLLLGAVYYKQSIDESLKEENDDKK